MHPITQAVVGGCIIWTLCWAWKMAMTHWSEIRRPFLMAMVGCAIGFAAVVADMMVRHFG